MTGLRVVPPAGTAPAAAPVTMAEAVLALAATVAAEDPTLFMCVWEKPAGKLNVRTVPESPYVAEILSKRVKLMLEGVDETD